MKELRENGYKRISVSTKEVIVKDFFVIPGVADLKQEHRSASFIFNGNAMTIMNKLCQLELEDISIEEPSLEEIFLHYYE